MNHRAESARNLLQSYLRMIAKQAGVRWDSDNDAEVGDIVELIMQAVDIEVGNAIENHAHHIGEQR